MAESQPATAGTKPPSSQSSSEQPSGSQILESTAASLQELPLSFSPASPWSPPPPSPIVHGGLQSPTSCGAASPSRATSSDLLTQASSEEASTHSGSASVPQVAATAHLSSAATAAGEREVGGGAGETPEDSVHATEGIRSPSEVYHDMLQAASRSHSHVRETVRLFVLELLTRLSYCRFPAASFIPSEDSSTCVARSLDGLLPAMAEDLVLNSIPYARQCAGALQPEIQQPLIAWAIVAGHRSQRQCYLNGQLLDATVRIGDYWSLVSGSGESKRLVFLCNSMLTYIEALGVRVHIQTVDDSISHESSTSGPVEPVYGCIPGRKTVKSSTDGGEHFRKFMYVASPLEQPAPSADLTLRVLFWHIAFVLQEVAAHVCIKRSPASEGGKRKLCPDVLGVDITLSTSSFMGYQVVLRTEGIVGDTAKAYLKNKSHPGLPGVDKLRSNLRVLDACLDTLKRVHRAGIVHCDVKPENFMIQVDREANTCIAVLIDLEGARANMDPEDSEGDAIAAMQAGLAGLFVGEFGEHGEPGDLIKSMVEAAIPGLITTARYQPPFLCTSHLLPKEESILGLHITSGLDMWSVGVMVMEAILGEAATDPYLPGNLVTFRQGVHNLAKRVEYLPEETPCLPRWHEVQAALGSHLLKMGATEPGPLVLCLGKCFARSHKQVPSAEALQDELLHIQAQLHRIVADSQAEPQGDAREMPAVAGAGGSAAAEPLHPSHSTAPQTASADSYLGAR